MDNSHQPDSSNIYERALARVEFDLGLTPSKAHIALAGYAAAYGLFLDDVAKAVLNARTIKRGLNLALKQASFERRPLH